MAENTTDAPKPDQPTPKPEPKPEPADETKTLAEEHRLRRAAESTIEHQRRELEKLSKALKVLEDKGKTEEQRRADELEAAKGEAKAAEEREAKANLSLLRYQVGARKGLDTDLIGRLVGETEDELEADAEALAEKYGASAQRAPRAPVPDRTLGRGTSGKPSTADQFASLATNLLNR